MLNYLKNADNYNELISSIEEFYKTSSRMFICIDYVPLSLFEGTLCYGVLDKNLSVTFRPSFASNSRANSALRKFYISSTQIQINLRKVDHYLEESDPSGETFSTIRNLLDTNLLKSIASHMYSTGEENFHDRLCDEIYDLTDKLAYLEESQWDSTSRDIKIICEHIINLLSEYTSKPDTLTDLLNYAAISSGDLEGDYQVIYIPELNALNIMTPKLEYLKQNDPIGYDCHMFFANYEMLRLFTYRLPVGGCRFSHQNTLSLLTEYVPIAMKFKNIYNPLFDSDKNIWEELCRGFKWMQNVEVCDNRCSLSGARIDNSTTMYSPSDPETYHQSRIYFGLCCDIDQAFGRGKISIVPPDDVLGGVLYSTDLAAALMYRMLINIDAKFIKTNDLAGVIAWFEDPADEKNYISICAAQQKPLFTTSYNKIAHKDFTSIMLYRTLLTSGSHNIFDPVTFSQDAGQMEAQFSSITLNTFGGI